MLTYSLASNAARRVNFDEVYGRAFNDSRPGPGVKLLRIDGGLKNGGQPANAADLFPSNPTEAATLNIPYVAGTRVLRTVRHASPSAVIATECSK